MTDEQGVPRQRAQATYADYFGTERDMTDAGPLAEMTLDHLFGRVWSRPRLSLRDRSLITLALLASQGRDDQIEAHLAGARAQGLEREDIEELMLHVAHYAGWAAGVHGMTIVDRSWPE